MSSAASHRLQVRLLGYPVGHSLSPLMHGAAFAALGIDADYAVWETLPAQLADRIRALRGAEFLGANVTIPHKEQVLALLDEVSPLALRAGAVNTIVKRGTILHGENTDIGGFLWPLRAGGAALDRWRVTLLGAGGAARGVAVALLDAGVPRLTIVNRTATRARALANALADERVEVLQLGDAWVGGALAQSDLVVNATAAGWRPEDPPILDADLIARLPGHAIVYDLTYRRTPLLRVAEARGLATIDGLPMLVEQGALAFQFWTGREAPRPAMWAAAQAGRA
ncbi:MAG: shikimate dehydrogenase [Chloroflexia bacterium]